MASCEDSTIAASQATASSARLRAVISHPQTVNLDCPAIAMFVTVNSAGTRSHQSAFPWSQADRPMTSVLKASVGSEALEIAKRRKQPIHLLLTDVVIPQMSGRELCEKITRIHPETKVIFMSGYSNNLLSSQQGLDPKHELVQKPFRLTTLGRRIREIPTGGLAASAGK
jgi:CheY-like chemotaxis protein